MVTKIDDCTLILSDRGRTLTVNVPDDDAGTATAALTLSTPTDSRDTILAYFDQFGEEL